MKQHNNILSVANINPDYMGFIFYQKSKRYYQDTMPKLDQSIHKTGVFVNESIDSVMDMIKQHQLMAVQLHGDESVTYCNELRKMTGKNTQLIKVFSIDQSFDFKVIDPYINEVDYFLFDTKGKERGGNGIPFSWDILKNYSVKKPYFLSGGLNLNHIDQLKEFFKKPYAKYCIGLDVNSGFEIEPGLKSTEQLKEFQQRIKGIK